MTARFSSPRRKRSLRLALMSGVAAANLFPAAVRSQTFDLNGADAVLPAAPNFPDSFLSGSANVTNSGGAATLSEGGGTAASAMYSGVIADGAGTVGLTHTSGATVLVGANTYSGATNVLGGSLLAGSTAGFSPNSLFTIASGATLDLNGFSPTAGNLAGAGTLTNNGAQAAWLYTNIGGLSTAFSGNIVDGASQTGLISTGPGTLALSGVNTNSLSTQIAQGTVQAGSITGLSPNAQVNLYNQGVLDINGFNSTVYGLIGSGGTVTNNGGAAATLTLDSSSSPTFYGVVQDGNSPLAITISGNGIQSLSGMNTYSGTTTINAGANLQFGDGNSIATFGSGAIVNNGVLTFQEGSGAGTQLTPLAGDISGGGSILQQGPGTVTLTGNNSFTGGIVVNPNVNGNPSWYQYQLLFGSASSLPTAAFANGGAIDLENGGVAGTTYALDQNFLNAVTTTTYGAVALGADSQNDLSFDSPVLANISLGAASAQCDSGYICNTFNYSGQITAYGDSAGQGVYQFGGGNAVLNVESSLSDQDGSTRSLVQGANGVGGYTSLSGENSYTGGTSVVSGVLQFNSEGAIPQLGTPSIAISPYAVVAAGYALDQATLNTITPGSQGVIALAYTDTSENAGATVLDFNTPGLQNVSLGAVGSQTYYGTILPYVAQESTQGTFLLGGGPAPTNYFSGLTVAAPLTNANASGEGATNQLIVNAAAFTNPINVYLTNNETYTGATIVQGGVLTLGDGVSNGNLINTSSVQLQNFSTLAFFEGAGAVTFDRLISGDGYVDQFGPGTVTLTRVETYAASSPATSGADFGGGTYISGGTLALGPAASIASSTFVALQNYSNAATPPTLDISNAGDQTIQYLFGTQNTSVLLGANTLTLGVPGESWLTSIYYTNNPNNSNNVQPYFLGSISGTGGVVFQLPTGQTPYIFGGTNSYSGATTIASGIVQAAGVDALSPNSAVTVLSGATLDIAGYSQTIGSLAGAGTLTNSIAAPATLTLGGDNTSTLFSGLLTDTGASGALTLDKVGSGTFTLTGANGFSGGVLLEAGTLGVGNAQALGTGALTISPGATLQFAAALSLPNAVVLSGPGLQFIDSGALSVELAGPISGSGALDKIGSGVLNLPGANSYTGGTTLSAGTLGLGDNGALGSGALTMAAGTSLQFTAANLNLANSVALAGAGLYDVDTGSQTASLSGAISGAGTLQKVGVGTLVLSGASTFSGGVDVTAGTLGVGANGALGSGALTMTAGTGLQFIAANLNLANSVALAGSGLYRIDTGSQTASMSGVITGAGTLEKVGAGTLVLSGANTFSGGIDVTGGTLGVTSAAALSSGPLDLSDGTTFQVLSDGLNVSNPVALLGADPNIDTGANSLTMSGVISGPGDLTKLGSGALILTGANTYTGATNVNAGTLEVDGSIASSPLTTVGSGATLLGIGRVGGLALNSGGVLAPGNAASPYGTLTATGAVSLATGSTYAINLSPGAVSLLTIAKNASVGGIVAVNAVTATYNPATKYDILTAAGGVTGTFGAVTLSGLPGFSGLLTYDPNNVYLQILQGDPTASVHDLAVSRETQMVTTRILGSLLIGANEQINCSTCVSGFASVGSLSVGTHGRWPLSERLTLLAGASFDEFSAGGAQVTSAPIVAASLRYDLVDWGRSRPFFEAGATVAPYEVSKYTRNYAYGGLTGQGVGSTTSSGVSAFGRAGWVWRASKADEIAVYGDINRNWQKTDGYSETTNILNPQSANFASGVDTFNIVRVGGQYTRLVNPRLEVNANLAIAYGFGAGVGVDANVPGFGVVPNTNIGNSTWIEFGGRVGYHFADRFVLDAFLLGTAGAKPAGETLHGGLGLRYSF